MSTHKTRDGPHRAAQTSPTLPTVVSITQACRSVNGPVHAESGRDVYEVSLRITQAERVIIRAYLHERCIARAAAGVLVQRQRSPLQRPLIPGGILQSKLQTQPLPAELECRLGTVPEGYDRVLIDHNVLLIKTATRKIISVMRNACAIDGLGRCVARERNPRMEMSVCSASVFDPSTPGPRHYERSANS